MSPQRSIGTEPPRGSQNSSRDRTSPPEPPSDGRGFTERKQFSAQNPGREPAPEEIDPEATGPFPPDLFRLPVPNRVFREMPSLGDAALRCLLALIHRSFRFDPEASAWTCPERQFSRSEIEAISGLSGQGTRNGLKELEEAGYVDTCRSGRSYSYALRLGVPSRRYTYVPTALLEKASGFPTGAALRAVLAVLRATWGWTSTEEGSGETAPQTVHKRWAELPMPTLAELTGRSEPAVREAIRVLEGTWISRVRPSGGARLYRILPSAFLPSGEAETESKAQEENASSKTPTANESSPERQQTFPPSSCKKSFSKDRQTQKPESNADTDPGQSCPQTSDSGTAVPDSPNQSAQDPAPDFSDLPDRKQSLAEKLTNAGIWPRRAQECLHHYSVGRVEANFQLWRTRKNDPEAPEIENDGAWLTAAIVEGYSDFHQPCPEGREEEKRSSSKESGFSKETRKRRGEWPDQGSSLSTSSNQLPNLPGHKEKISAERKGALLRRREDTDPEHFHRYRHAENPAKKQFLYFDPSVGRPTRRVQSRNQPG